MPGLSLDNSEDYGITVSAADLQLLRGKVAASLLLSYSTNLPPISAPPKLLAPFISIYKLRAPI